MRTLKWFGFAKIAHYPDGVITQLEFCAFILAGSFFFSAFEGLMLGDAFKGQTS